MLGASNVIAFAATVDSAKARAFYEHVLGLQFVSEDEFAVVFHARGRELRIQKVRAFTPQPHTQLGWSVNSIEQVVRVLRDRGAVFERYSYLKQDSHGIWTAPSGAKIAWLKDPDGNLLSVTQQVGG
jgi:predicted enzyme related to lactoylglutathione lyase